MEPTLGRRRILWGAAAALLLAGCSAEKEPDEAAIRQALEHMHQGWAAELRKDQNAKTPDFYRGLPNVNLAFEAKLSLRFTSIRKLGCTRPPDDRVGFICRAVVGASVAGQVPVLQNIQGRFIQDFSGGWTVRDLVVLNPAG